MNQERAKQFMRDFDNVLERLRETTGAEEINELKKYFVNEYPEIFHVECGLEEVNEELERIVKHELYTYTEQCKKLNNQHFHSEVISRITTRRSWIQIKVNMNSSVKSETNSKITGLRAFALL